jgi:DNA-binding NarL/FixJ family response regulator
MQDLEQAMRQAQLRAVIAVCDGDGAGRLMQTLSKRSISAIVTTDLDQALGECRMNPPDLAIVGDSLSGMTGIRFLAELLKISWKTATILISDEEEEALHQQTEGLGILGAIRTVDDTESLHRLLDKFFEIASINQQYSSAGE